MKRSLLSFVLIAGLACPAAQASISDVASNTMSTVKSGLTTGFNTAYNTCTDAKNVVIDNAKNLFAIVAAHKKETAAGLVGLAAVSVAVYYAYKHFVTDKK